MNFCKSCENMYYIKFTEDENPKLVYFCRGCNFVDESIPTEGICVLDTNFRESETRQQHFINKYTKLDPTLPRTTNIKCPNVSCSAPKDSLTNEIIYVRYDDANLKYLHICSTCDTVWK